MKVIRTPFLIITNQKKECGCTSQSIIRCGASERNFSSLNSKFDLMSKREITSFFAPKSKRTRVEKNEENEEINEEEQKEIVEEKVSSVSSDLPSHDESGSNETSQSIEPVKTPRDAPLFDLGTWSELLENEFTKSYFKNLMRYVDHEYSTATVYPPKDQVFTAFTTCNLDQLKVVIIGQDPYHGPNQAHGMAFSVLEGNTPPPSLRNIFKEAKVIFFIKSSSSLDSLMSEYPSQSMAISLVGVVRVCFYSILF